MPIYEFSCNTCGRRFSKLILVSQDKEEIRCPHCGSADVKRLFSPFGSLGSSTTPGGCTSFS